MFTFTLWIILLIRNFCLVESMAWTICISYIMKNELSGVNYEEQVCHKIFIIYSLTISIVMTSIYTGMVAEINYITGRSIFRVLKGIIDYQICFLLVGLVFIFAPLCYLQYFNIKKLIKFSKEKKPIVKSQIKRLLVFLVIILICIFVT